MATSDLQGTESPQGEVQEGSFPLLLDEKVKYYNQDGKPIDNSKEIEKAYNEDLIDFGSA